MVSIMGNLFTQIEVKPKYKDKNASQTRKSKSPKIDVQEIFGSHVTKKGDQYELICTGQESTKFTIKQDILLDKLIGCDTMTGKEILNKIIKIADRLNKNIELTDVSYKKFETMECRYSLYHFHILLHGESWYNKFGFKSHSHEEDKLHNAKIRNLPLYKFIQMAKDAYITKELRELDMDCEVMERRPFLYKELELYKSVDKFKESKTKEIIETELFDMDDFIIEFGTFDADTKVSSVIADIFKNYIEKENPTTCNRKIQLLKQFIDISRYVLKYNKHLIRKPKTNGTRNKKI